MTTTTTITNTDELYQSELLEGAIQHGALVSDADNRRWLAWDGEDGVYCVRPPYEGEPGYENGRARFKSLDTLPFPLTITTEEN